MAGGGGRRRRVVRPGSPHLLPIPVPGIPAERRSARRPEGEARSGPLPCSDLTASSPQTVGPRGPFCMDSGLQGRLGPGSLAPLLTSTQPTGISVAPGNGLVLVSERQSRKGLRRGRRGPRGFCHQSLRRKPTLPPPCRPTATMGLPPPKLLLFQKKGLVESVPAFA